MSIIDYRESAIGIGNLYNAGTARNRRRYRLFAVFKGATCQAAFIIPLLNDAILFIEIEPGAEMVRIPARAVHNPVSFSARD